MKAIIWNYKYTDMRETWHKQMLWLINSLLKENVEVKIHKNFKCRNTDNLPIYNHETDRFTTDICIYNHADSSEIIGNVLPSKQNWFFKPTVPTEYHTTIDTLGYGPYSSITYNKPEFENIDIPSEFWIKVNDWKTNKLTKFGNRFENKITDIPYEDYHLIIGQCSGDSVVTRFDFGNYIIKLEQIIKELVRISDRNIIVKLHPYMDGEHAINDKFSESIEKTLRAISKKVIVYRGKNNIHSFISKAHSCILANSGAGFEVMMHGKPIIAWGCPEYHWVAYDLRHLSDLHQAIKLNWFDRAKQNKFLYYYCEKYCFYNQETCDRRVKELLNNT